MPNMSLEKIAMPVQPADERIKNFEESKRKRILHDIMESRSIQQVIDKEWVEEKWRSFKGLGGTV